MALGLIIPCLHGNPTGHLGGLLQKAIIHLIFDPRENTSGLGR